MPRYSCTVCTNCARMRHWITSVHNGAVVKVSACVGILVEGELVSSTYERPNGKGKKSATTKTTSWSIRADVVRKLDRNEPQPEAAASAAAGQAPGESDAIPY